MIRIITDSTSDISQEEAKKLGIDVIPLTVAFGEESFIDGITITSNEFYKKLQTSSILPKTSQPSPAAFEKIYRKYIDAGDEIISLHISTELSGTGQSAKIAAEMVNEDKITVIDSLNVTGALNVLVRAAVMHKEEGLSREDIVAKIFEYIPKLRLYVIVNTLEYLKKGGRIKPGAAIVGDVISLHPVLTVRSGFVEVAAKVIGDKATIKWLDKHIDTEKPADNLPIIVGHSAAPEKSKALLEKLEAKNIKNIVDNIELGSVVGTYAGPGSVGMFYIAE